ncbi:MAG: hypothetical protein K2O54_01160, partial [Prevotella sp.]|nr:hypothetical protein [Prevotella sp.]
MGMQPIVCANCGDRINVDDVDLNGFAECESCHTSYKVIDLIRIDGLPTAKTYLVIARSALDDNDLEKAKMYFNKVLEIKPNCYEAWWGLYVCQRANDRYYGYEDKYGNSGPIVKANIMANAIEKYARRAIEYAPDDIARAYEQEIKEDVDYINDVINGSIKEPLNTQKNGCYI